MNLKVISTKEFHKSLHSNFTFEKNPHIGLSLSGGVDSMALMILMHNWIKKNNGKLTIFHFNHNLRKESAQEAEFVSSEIKKIGLQFYILDWGGIKNKSSLMERARNARYEAIINICKELNILHLMTGHHLDDNIETYFMRLKRKKSTLGLSSIPQKKIMKHLQIIRPLINFKKQRLVDTCFFYKLKWINDPSNENEKFERPRIRKELKKKKSAENEKLIKQFGQRKIKNEKIEKTISDFFVKELKFYKYGVFELKIKSLLEQREHIKIEIFKKLLTTCSGKFYSPARDSVKDLISKLLKEKAKKQTLHSCLISVVDGKIRFSREIFRKNSNKNILILEKGTPTLWDNRFYISSDLFEAKCEEIDEKKWIGLKKKFSIKKSKINFTILQSLPLIRIKKNCMIPFLSSDSDFSRNKINFYFCPKIPLTKKNFFRY